MEFDMHGWQQNRRAEQAARTRELYAEITDKAINAYWSVAQRSAYGFRIARDGKELSVDLSGGIVCSLVYMFGDGRHFAVAEGDERRHASGMEMSEILNKWIEGKEPDPHTGRV